MSGVQTKTSRPALNEDDFVYDNNQSEAELFAKKFASVSSNSNPLDLIYNSKRKRSNSNTVSHWSNLKNQREQRPMETRSPLRLILTS